jgi:hypothetical protein
MRKEKREKYGKYNTDVVYGAGSKETIDALDAKIKLKRHRQHNRLQ